MQGDYGRREFVLCCLVVSGLPFWASSGIGGLLSQVVGHGGVPEWSGPGRLGEVRLGAWGSARAGLGGLLGACPSV